MCDSSLYSAAFGGGWRQSKSGDGLYLAEPYSFKGGVSEEERSKFRNLEAQVAEIAFRQLAWMDPDEAGRLKQKAAEVRLPCFDGVHPVANMFNSSGYSRNEHGDDVVARVFGMWFNRKGKCVGGGELGFPRQRVLSAVPETPETRDGVIGTLWDGIEAHCTPDFEAGGDGPSVRLTLGIIPQTRLWWAAACDMNGVGKRAIRRADLGDRCPPRPGMSFILK